jgi:hypothetical protein
LKTPLRALQTVIDRISDQVKERILHFLKDPFIDLHLSTFDHQIDFFSLDARELPDLLAEKIQEGATGKHDELPRIFKQIAD